MDNLISLYTEDILRGLGFDKQEPGYYEVFQWFREVHKLHSSIAWVTKGYDFYVKKEPSRIVNLVNSYSNYRECEIACIEYMINLVKNER